VTDARKDRRCHVTLLARHRLQWPAITPFSLACSRPHLAVISTIMPEVTQLIEAASRGDRQAAADLLPLVYERELGLVCT
jgi:hypothetical protein